jgi:biopolymer transport protein ExbD
MARKPSERSHSKSVEAELNLAPIMSILVILIPMLIFAFQFYEITVQTVNAPKLGTGKAKKAESPDKVPLNLTVLISDKGFIVKQQGSAPEEAPLIKRKLFNVCQPTAFVDGMRWDDCSGKGKGKTRDVVSYDYPKLYSLIAKKFAEHDKGPTDKEESINIGADFNVPWHVVARTIDCVRTKLAKEDAKDAWAKSFTELDEYRKAPPLITKIKNTDGTVKEIRQEPMFSKIVFVVAQ